MRKRVTQPAGHSAKRPATMKDVARAAGVAQSTVSRILNDSPLRVPISPQTRERVLDAARELGYRPNPFARGLRGAPTMLLGVIVRDITDPFFARAIDCIAAEARGRGYSVVLGHAREQADEALALAAVLEARQCDAIVLLGDMRDEPQLIDDLRAAGVAVVEAWHGSRHVYFPSVNVDNRAGIHVALDHLVELGHTRIAFVGGPTLGDIAERREAFVEFLAARGLDLPPEYVQRARNTPQSGAEALLALNALEEPPSAVVTSTDVLALGILHAAYECGLSVPRELSVVGFDDIPFASVSVPALTTVRMPVQEMMAAAVAMAVGGASGRDGEQPHEVRIFEPHLVVRASTARAEAL